MDETKGYHITLHKKAYPHGYGFFEDISGAVIVEHARGLVAKGEQPHYHIWLPWDAISDADKKVINKQICTPYRRKIWDWLDTKEGDKIDRGKWNQAYFVLIEHHSFENWLNYTINPDTANVKEPKIKVWNLPDSPPEVRSDFSAKSLVLVESNEVVLSPSVAHKPKPKVPNKMELFSKYVVEYYALDPHKEVTREKILKLLFEWSKGGISKFKVVEFCNRAMYDALLSKGDSIKPFRTLVMAEWSKLFF